jgi:transcriptional regulator with XRE-family HTH domain
VITVTPNERLKKLVDDEGRKYIWLAQKTELPLSTVSDVLNGKRSLDANLILKFCAALKCPASAIIPTPYDNATYTTQQTG